MNEIEFAKNHAETLVDSIHAAIKEDMEHIFSDIKFVSEMHTDNITYQASELVSVLNSSVIKDLQVKLGALQTAREMMQIIDYISK